MGLGQGRGRGSFGVGRGGCGVGVVVREGRLGGGAAPGALAHDHQENDAGQAAPREDLGEPLPRREMPEERQREGLDAQLGVARDEGEEEDREGDHDQPVGGLDPRAPLKLTVGEGRGDDAPEALAHGGQAPRVGRARADGAPHVGQASRERQDGQGAHQQGESPHDGAQRRIGHVSSSRLLHSIVSSRQWKDRFCPAKRAQLRAVRRVCWACVCSPQRGYMPRSRKKCGRVRACFPSRSQT